MSYWAFVGCFFLASALLLVIAAFSVGAFCILGVLGVLWLVFWWGPHQ